MYPSLSTLIFRALTRTFPQNVTLARNTPTWALTSFIIALYVRRDLFFLKNNSIAKTILRALTQNLWKCHWHFHIASHSSPIACGQEIWCRTRKYHLARTHTLQMSCNLTYDAPAWRRSEVQSQASPCRAGKDSFLRLWKAATSQCKLNMYAKNALTQPLTTPLSVYLPLCLSVCPSIQPWACCCSMFL